VRDHKNALLVQPVGTDLTEETLATVQHALLRGVEAVFQLEEGEVLAEPMPSRDARNGFLLYEATEGGAGVLTRIASEADSLARVARQALQVMHFDVPEEGPLPDNAAALIDVADTECVAGCYRCLLSYYNQPDHELINRRDEGAKTVLLRLAASSTLGLISAKTPLRASYGSEAPAGGWLSAARARLVLEPDAEPLVIDGVVVQFCWRTHYVAAVFPETPTATRRALDDRGFTVVEFLDESTWPVSFAILAHALGHTA